MASMTDRPAILIALPTENDVIPTVLQPLFNGIEEEAIPIDSKVIDEENITARAYQAALASRLSVGIGYDDQQVVVHYKNLKPDQPLFVVPIDSAERLRRLGANAARLVKGVPFKKLV